MNRDQWNNVFEFVKAFGDFDDHGAYDPDGGIFQIFKKLYRLSQTKCYLTEIKLF